MVIAERFRAAGSYLKPPSPTEQSSTPTGSWTQALQHQAMTHAVSTKTFSGRITTAVPIVEQVIPIFFYGANERV